MFRFGHRKEVSEGRFASVLPRLLREEDGALIPLALYMLLVTLVSVGFAIDFVRAEERRSVIQNTLDRAALAAASRNQKLPPADVVKDYLLKAGLQNLSQSVTPIVEEHKVGDKVIWRRVTIEVADDMPKMFAPVSSYEVAANTQAYESIGNLEISMVLDVSGSMDYVVGSTGRTRLSHLKEAAKTFVNTMFEQAQPDGAPAGKLSISVVPYSANVYLGPEMQQAYTLSNDFSVVDSSFFMPQCADFSATDMSSIPIDGSQPLTRTMLGTSADVLDYTGSESYTANPLGDSWWNCFNFSQNRVIPLSNNKTFLLGTNYPYGTNGYIDGLIALGGTSTDIGAKWGLALLDPSSKDEVSKITSVSNDLAGRPFDYDKNSLKVLLLMSDGDNSTSYSTLPGYRHGPSGIKSLLGINNLNGMAPFNTAKSNIYYYDSAKAAQGDSRPYFKYSNGTWVGDSEFTRSRVETTTTVNTASCSKFYNSYTRKWYWESCSVPTSYCTVNTYWSSTQRTYACSQTVTTNTTVYYQAPLYDVNYEYLYQTQKWNLYAVASLLARPFNRTTHAQYDVMALQSENILDKGLTDKDTRLQALCTQAKSNGVVVFTVAAGASAHGVGILKSCATGDAYAYNVDASDLSNAFASIATSINSLRLTN